jgi:beta-lactamase regulating signal transducer with metallopeptidase domain
MNSETVRVLGWCLLHFVWQGAVLGLALSALLTRLRSPRARYGSALLVLAAMLLAPIVTCAILMHPADTMPLSNSGLGEIRNGFESTRAAAVSAGSNQLLPLVATTASTDWLGYAVLAWIAGVYMFTLRTLGAWMLLMRLRRQRAQPIAGDLLRTCLELQRRLGVSRVVRYVCSKSVESPAVLGWLRPVVVLPLSALVGLTPWQIEAIIAHELAHIRRWDAWVNLFQVATETLLFYHPAVWWVNGVIRNEREHCCDDVAVAACGNAPGYARALALLEESRSAYGLAMAANGGALTSRIARLLGVKRAARSMSAPSLAILAVFCIAGALMAGSASTQVSSEAPDVLAPPAPPAPPSRAPAAPPAPTVHAIPAMPSMPTIPMHLHLARLESVNAESASHSHESSTSKLADASEGGSYIGGLQAAGLKNLTVDEIIALKIHQVTPEYIRALRAAGLEATGPELVSLKIHEVTPEFVRELAAAGLTGLRVPEYLAARVQGITPEYVRNISSHGFKGLTIRQLISLKNADIS